MIVEILSILGITGSITGLLIVYTMDTIHKLRLVEKVRENTVE